MSQEYDSKLQVATREKLRAFNSLRGREVQTGEFWDVVVMTAVDESQREVYELQISEKVQRKELPLGPHYKVFSDPPGAKIGNGGSTLYALQQLNDLYGKTLSTLRIILIHAGGWSQRLPSASALGKIFTALPLGNPLYQMLELKLAMYVDFPRHMKPGVLVTCADDIEIYSISEDESVRFDKPGFTALAHPSPLSIGTTHGVFVLLSHENSSNYSEMQNTSCVRYLHKPSIQKMRESGAVCQRQSGCFSLSDTEFVYTDSTYYIDSDMAKSLLNLLKELGPLEVEIDAYGDFLQALGPEATVDYTKNTANVSKKESSLVEIRQRIFNGLKGTPLNVILLNNSKFYHIGTISEYLFHLTQDVILRQELGLLTSAFSIHSCDGSSGGCVMFSVLDSSCSVGAGSVVEYCKLGAGVSVGKGSIVSSCCISAGLSVPDGVFIHSLCVSYEQQAKYVTVFFGINDDLKHGVESPAFMEELKLSGFSLSECLSLWGMKNEALNFSGDPSHCSLWNACLFPVCSDQQSSFSMSVEMLQAVLNGSTFTLPQDTKLMSMQESLECKRLQEMLKFRRTLYDDIIQLKQGK
ncbi:fucose-1-phosphate guanylyltransferase [Cheilinus undulatus]|uniref:fucose-1-phosphate guanylyltransferase n=1 Tax=Cheilinus undulatus TaxID=241271 RepID=UPI001BD3B120|nr:fucose-1-phosphate guanylyltransferase [Cheilinus undulatus]